MQRQWVKACIWMLLILVVVGGIIFIPRLNKKESPSPPQNKASETSNDQSTPAPTVALTDVTDGETVSGTITFSADIGSSQDVRKVEYYIDNVFGGVSYAPPFTFSLDTTKLTNGEHKLLLKVYNKSGKVASSEERTIKVDNKTADGEAAPVEGSGNATGGSGRRGTTSSAKTNTGSSSGGSSGSNSGSSGGTPDTQAPSAPANLLLSADDGYTTNVSWDASTDNVGVTSYQIFRDGAQIGTSSTPSYKDQTVVPGNTYAYSARAVDAKGNTSGGSNEPSITLVTTSVWIDGDKPASFVDDSGSYELGVKFKPKVNGKITGIRFYKAPGATSSGHTGSLWPLGGGSALATATFTSETSSGWQSVTFSTPVDVTAGTTYVASYFSPDAVYGYTNEYFSAANGGISSQYLQVEGNNGSPFNGLFNVGSGYPATVASSNTNYWVDVNFTPNPAAGGPTPKTLDTTKVYTGFPGTNNTGVTVGRRLPIRDRKIDIVQPNTLVENIEVQTEINIKADNAHIKNVRVAPPNGGGWAMKQDSSVSGALIEDAEMYGTSTHQMQYGIRDDGSNMTVKRVNIYCWANGIQSNSDVTIQDSIVHDPCFFTGDHTDAFIATGGSGFNISHNTLHNNLSQTAAAGFFCDFGPITDVNLDNNLLIGGAYAVYGGSTGIGNCTNSQNNKFTNNKFSKEVWPTGGYYGPVGNYDSLPGNVWSGNTWYEDGTPVVP